MGRDATHDARSELPLSEQILEETLVYYMESLEVGQILLEQGAKHIRQKDQGVENC